MNMIRVWFSKTGEASYISLLDLQRVMGRSIKRSGVPAWYTKGFNPHVYLSFACPLSLGQESLVESFEFKTEAEPLDFEGWKNALNAVMPAGIHVFKVCLVEKKAEEIGFSRYKVSYPAGKAVEAVEAYNALPEALVEKKSKRGMKTVDLKEYIPSLTMERGEETDSFELVLPAGVSFTVNPALLTGYFEKQYGLKGSDAHILRTELMMKDMEKFD